MCLTPTSPTPPHTTDETFSESMPLCSQQAGVSSLEGWRNLFSWPLCWPGWEGSSFSLP